MAGEFMGGMGGKFMSGAFMGGKFKKTKIMGGF